MPFVWNKAPAQAFPGGYDSYAQDVYQTIMALVLIRSAQIEAWMKANAIWIDRTGNARQSLHTDVLALKSHIKIALSHGMTYGKWLELAHGGTYAIITPALDFWGPVLWEDVRGLF